MKKQLVERVLEVGNKVFIRTVTNYFTGLIVYVDKVLAPGHGFNSERSQRAENGGRP